ncbi:LysR family transcriptional regulator [Pokkaliibacter sp. CJK22405]|uniref:LysR family transcriptional regulator n=1 Tax=Pokkaliibacter sp. CJK22405 TaxID=3384615 RepID=UPI00398462B3
MLHITVRQLEAFAAIARHGNLTAAAEALSLTKGALSQALQQLENQLGTPLFDRVHPRLQLNSEGQQLQPMVEDALSRLTDIAYRFHPERAAQGVLRLGASQTIGNYLLPALLARLQREGNIRPDVRITNTHQLGDRLLNFELDLALIEGEIRHPDIHSQHWREDEMVVVAAPTHALATATTLTVRDLSGQAFVLREPNSGSRERFDHDLLPGLEHCGQLLQLNTLEAVMQAIEQGLGLTLISELAVADRLASGRLIALPLTQRFPRELRLAWHRKKYHTRLMQRFIELCEPQTSATTDT